VIVLDTHAWVFFVEGQPLRPKAVSEINQARQEGNLAISAMSCWEVSLLVRKGRLTLSPDIGVWLDRALSIPGMSVAPLTEKVAIDAANLPGAFHDDPADRFIVATARVFGATLVTRDHAILRYAGQGHVKALGC
jgi:PIN domain nuclease of toxin-antitoxin system